MEELWRFYVHSRLLRFDEKNWRVSYNSLNLLRAPADSWTRECCKRVSKREKCKGENVEDNHMIINRVQVTDESVEYLKSGSAVFSVLRNLGKSEQREVVRDICETNNQIQIQGANGSEEYFRSSSVSNIFGTKQDPLAKKTTLKIGLNISDGIMQRERQHGDTSEVLGLGDKVSNTQIEHTLVPLKSAYMNKESVGSFLELFQRPNLKDFITGGGLILPQQITRQHKGSNHNCHHSSN